LENREKKKYGHKKKLYNNIVKRLKKLRQEVQQMTESKKNSVDKAKIVEQIADLSRLLGMIDRRKY